MNTFKQFLAEKQEVHSIAQSILFGTVLPPLIFTPSMMQRLDYTITNVTAFHITSPEILKKKVSS